MQGNPAQAPQIPQRSQRVGGKGQWRDLKTHREQRTGQQGTKDEACLHDADIHPDRGRQVHRADEAIDEAKECGLAEPDQGSLDQRKARQNRRGQQPDIGDSSERHACGDLEP
jgi:hypothetical protein